MKLVFKKDEESQISVFQQTDNGDLEFSYVEMIKELIRSRRMEDPEMSQGFSEAEIKSINSMVKYINMELSPSEEAKPDLPTGTEHDG